MKTEKEFSKFSKPRLESFWSIESFEAGGNLSTPDWYLVHPTLGYSAWVELKVVKSGRVEFQPGQCKWLESHYNKGGVAFVMVLSTKVDGEGEVVSLFPANSARWISSSIVRSREELAQFLSRSLTPPLPLDSPALWESLGREIVKASQEADNRREATRAVSNSYSKGMD